MIQGTPYRCLAFLLAFTIAGAIQAQRLKSIVYDFDGLDAGSTNIPEGDYAYGDLSFAIDANPLAPNDMLGDRVLKVNLNWNLGYGSFGRGISRYIEFDPAADRLNFFLYNPPSNNQNANFNVIIGEDDNQNNVFEFGADDQWTHAMSVPASGGWQFFSLPLSAFTDNNAGGNGQFDAAFSSNKGMLLYIEFRFSKAAPAVSNASFYIDMIHFTEGTLPSGNDVFTLPPKDAADHCLLGAYRNMPPGQNQWIPSQFEIQFPKIEGKKLRYVNLFIDWAYGGSTTPVTMPGNDLQALINDGYTPILTWEPMFNGFDRLHPVQPRLSNIISGQYDSYIDAFAEKMKQYTDTIIIRVMHEFDGDWYSWSIVHNSQNPALYVSAFRHFVDRFRAKGVTRVKWMWCVNSDYAPYEHYNWIVNAYPGDNYVDIVATDIYNNHYPENLPWWRSFRWQTTETYYYLDKYFPNKPLLICEAGCRERFQSENPASQSKGAWFAVMDKELQSFYRHIRGLVFFDAAPDQNWLVGSSENSIQSLTQNIWQDDYYFRSPVSALHESLYGNGLYVYPNPNESQLAISFNYTSALQDYTLRIVASDGKQIYREQSTYKGNSFTHYLDISAYSAGVYFVVLEAIIPGSSNSNFKQVRKLLIR